MGGVDSGTFADDWGVLTTDTYKAGYEGEVGDTKVKTFIGMTRQGTNWFIESGFLPDTTWARGCPRRGAEGLPAGHPRQGGRRGDLHG